MLNFIKIWWWENIFIDIIFYNSCVVVPTIPTDTALRNELERNFQLVIVELVNSDTNWEELFSRNFKTHKKDGVVCNIKCPVILQWSSWSCHCSQSQGQKPYNIHKKQKNSSGYSFGIIGLDIWEIFETQIKWFG